MASGVALSSYAGRVRLRQDYAEQDGGQARVCVSSYAKATEDRQGSAVSFCGWV
jgi:hypothetical protein